jgi:ribose transport system permease protein
MPTSLSRFLKAHREGVILLVVVAVSAGFYVLEPGFMSVNNWSDIVVNMATDALMVVGMTLVIIAGGFDLSVGSTFALGAIVSCKLMVGGLPIPLAILVGLAAGAGVGAVNGFIVTKVGVNPLVTTLGMMGIVRGLCRVVTQANPVTGLPARFTRLGERVRLTATWEIPWFVFVMIVTVIVADLLLRHARFLRQVYYVGGNEEAARFSGIRVDWVRSFTYIMAGTLAAAAGIVSAARFTSVSGSAGERAELRVITAAVIGGASLGGGQGTILGAFLGLLLFGVIQSGMEFLHVNIYVKDIVLGTLLILAVMMDRINAESIRRLLHWLRK